MKDESNTSSEAGFFDRLFTTGFLRPFEKIWRKYKDVLLYLFFGGLAFLLNIALFALFIKVTNELIANIYAWIITVAFAYVTNRIWVFRSSAKETVSVIREIVSFFAGRITTLLMEEAMLWVGIDLMHINEMAVKVAAQIAVIVANYVISKLLVFRKAK